MRKLNLLVLALIATCAISCTEENLAEVVSSSTETFANDGEDSKKDPDEELPGGD